jgi:hypothetical protein
MDTHSRSRLWWATSLLLLLALLLAACGEITAYETRAIMDGSNAMKLGLGFCVTR